MARDLDPGSSPAAFLSAELRRARVAAGMSQEQFSRSLGFDRTVITKAETGERPPSPEVAAAIDEAFPHLDGLFSRLTLLARRANGRYPEWFREWVDAEQQATALRTWQPILVPGLLQTRDYARALFQAWQPAASSDDLDALVGARIERQAILDRADPPELLAVLDEAVLHRRVGSAKIMGGQLAHLGEMSCRPAVTIQIVPAEVGTHAGLLGGFFVGSFDDTPVIVYAETAVEGITIEKPALVSKAAQAFERLRSEALPRGASRDLIRRVAEQRWTT
jgi:transcriptional regulator with XRE-family HTH domain